MVIPHLFTKTKLPEAIPKEMEKVVLELKRTKNKEECLQKAYEIMTSKYKGYRGRTYYRAHELFITNVTSLWEKSGFLHCTHMNYLLRILLVRSGWFNDDEVNPQFTLVWFFSPHQYLRIKIDKNKTHVVDLWGKAYNIPYGEHARGFR